MGRKLKLGGLLHGDCQTTSVTRGVHKSLVCRSLFFLILWMPKTSARILRIGELDLYRAGMSGAPAANGIRTALSRVFESGEHSRKI